MFSGPTSHVGTVDSVMLYIVGISAALLIGITVVMIYFVFKYHRKKGHRPKDIHHNVFLEVAWIAIPTVLALSMFYFGYLGFDEIRQIPDDAMEIKATARMWSWDFTYDNGKVSDTLYVPVGKPVKLALQSVDVNHSLYIPAFRIKEDVMPNRQNYLGFTADEEGTYDIACAEFCGLNHSMMYSAVVTMKPEKFEIWLNTEDNTQAADTTAQSNTPADSSAEATDNDKK